RKQNRKESHPRNCICGSRRDTRDQERKTSADEGNTVKKKHCAAVAQAEVRKPMRSVILARRSKRQKAAARTGNRYQRSNENGHNQDQQQHEPIDWESDAFGPNLEA